MSVVNLGFPRRSEIGRDGVGMGKGKGAKLSFGQFFTENCTKMKEIGLRECTPFRSTKVCTSDFAALSQPIRRSKEGVWASVVLGDKNGQNIRVESYLLWGLAPHITCFVEIKPVIQNKHIHFK